MLQIKNINTYYGKVHVLRDVSIEVREQEIVSIIGANGAGKSTLMRSVMGIIHPKSGDIIFEGGGISRLKTDQVVKRGIVYVPEGREVFPELTVEENLEMGAFSKRYSSAKYQSLLAEMYGMYPRLKDRRKQFAGSLSGGEQQMLAIARGLMSEPKLIMFDEPSLGLAPVIVDEMFDAIVKINREKKLPVILVEQNAFAALSISHRCYVLENGVVTAQGPSRELINSPDVKKAYLGG
ncbi:ABC transporter ATP-binding protein [Enterocloster lavalensis]|uniref:Branched-chain amino acid transport system ATP-binding protein n=2 Tax=Enterocloster TaxID=2719313 RepID=A0A1I0CNL3_9FIRM|nr:ABC transporter ATP-binding protein [Enterocloster lavalensis]PST31480.1 ABC transporter ATP-binding protein [Enterocloster lavalensis]SET21076.1 branched-chain amino acid transport system ATP-binding protein [Enterocloster lavalensis]